MFRLLTADEIECRVAQTGKSQKGAWAQFLIYKDARTDQKLLDETVGPTNWKNSYEFINGNLYCSISIWDDKKKEWVSKQNVGTESNTEKEKGQASDAFKRAGFNWGIGRELYTAPKDIFIMLSEGDEKGTGKEYYEKDGKIQCRAKFYVSEISYNDSREIDKLVIKDQAGKIRYSFPKKSDAKEEKKEAKKSIPTYTSTDGKYKIQEGDALWLKYAQRVANGEILKDGTPIPIKMAECYNIPKEGMDRFLALVKKIADKNKK